jgi:hypothetical protein
MHIEKYFLKNNIINNLSKYETYYQVALGKLIYLTNAKDISYEVDFKLALGSIYELLNDLKKEEDLELIFEEELKKQTSMDAVQYFINKNIELIKAKEFKLEPIINDINDNNYFNKDMLEVFNENFKNTKLKYNDFITDNLAKQIYNSILKLQNQETINQESR